MAVTDWEPATEAEAGMRDALRVGDQERYFRILAGTDLFLPVSGQALAGAAPMGWGTWTTGGRTHVLAFTSTAAVHACLGASAGPCRRSRYADLAVEWPNHEWWLAVNPGLPIEGYLPAWFVSQLSRGDVRLPGRATGVRSRPEHEQTSGRNGIDGEPTADLSAGPAGWAPSRPVPPAGAVPPVGAVPPGGGVLHPAGGTTSTGERGRPATPPAAGPLDATGVPVDARSARPADMPGRPTTVPRRRVLGEESTGPANGRASFFEPSSTRGASRSPRENPLRSGERATPPARPGLSGQPFPRRRPAPAAPTEDETTRAFRVGSPAEQPVRPAAGNGTTTVGRRPDPLAEEPTRAFRVGPPAAEALPRRRIPDGASGARPSQPSTGPAAAPAAPTGPAAAPAAPTGPVPDEAEELAPSAAEPVSAPPAARRGFTPIVIEGVILESRDLPVVPAPAPAPPVVPGPSAVPPPPATPPVATTLPLATRPVAPTPPPAPSVVSLPPIVGGPDAGSTVTRNGTGPLTPPARPVTPGPVSPGASARPRPAPGDLWTPAAERTPANGSVPPSTDLAAPAPAPASTVEDTPATVPDAWSAAPDVASVPAGGPTLPEGAPAPPSAGVRPDRAAPPVAASVNAPAAGPAPTATGAPGAAAPGQPVPAAPAGSPEPLAAPMVRADPDDLWTPAAERAGRAAGRIGPAADRVAPVSPATGPTTVTPPQSGTTSAPPQSGTTSAPPQSGTTPAPPVPPPAGSEGPAATGVDELFQPANEVEENLLDAAGTGSTDGFLSTLLLARVLLPVNPDSASGSRPGEPGFAWRTVTTDGETCVVVYTSPERLAEHDVLPVQTIGVRFVQLIRRWPDPSWAFIVNPGTPVGAKLPGEQIVALASWAAEVGLGDEADLEPVAAAEAPAERTRYAPPATDPSRPVVMQKAIAPSQLAYYLERGYDRVSGFVHRAGELAHLTTPAELYDALGLGYPDSPFTRDAEAAYVLRWPAYRPSLYRIPYGGQNEAAMRAMEGWVIERAPFRGNGFAPGESSDVVAEFKVDSARLPHGAQLWRIGTEGTERVIAVLDTDALVWRRTDQP
ncbi:SseB family protein [Micromonospora rifamycinica]|uniref:SseB protein N-terminal domain-containing protein n=1 Tax=Micromonospora rifamycinica TaxID=291594 RepID=A0A1C5JCA4_9ACTN|nr:SseB protein N-terminal domain-containing protein [Micromonospora rifamycinica]